MLARLLRTVVLTLVATALLWCAFALRHGLAWPWLLLGAAGILGLPAGVLAAEFVLLARFGRDPGVPEAGASILLRAWVGEVRASTAAFGWRQAFAANAQPDVPARAGRRGVVLVHGFVCNRGLWAPWLRRLGAAGVPAIAVTMEPVFGSIEAVAGVVDAAVARMQAATGVAPLVVAHSMGGLVVRAWLRARDADARIAGVITIATPHHGTWLARLSLTTNGRQMRQGSAWLAALAAAEPASRLGRFTCFYGHCDNIVFPAGTARLPGAANRHVTGTAHVALVEHPEVFAEAMRQLQR